MKSVRSSQFISVESDIFDNPIDATINVRDTHISNYAGIGKLVKIEVFSIDDNKKWLATGLVVKRAGLFQRNDKSVSKITLR